MSRILPNFNKLLKIIETDTNREAINRIIIKLDQIPKIKLNKIEETSKKLINILEEINKTLKSINITEPDLLESNKLLMNNVKNLHVNILTSFLIEIVPNCAKEISIINSSLADNMYNISKSIGEITEFNRTKESEDINTNIEKLQKDIKKYPEDTRANKIREELISDLKSKLESL